MFQNKTAIVAGGAGGIGKEISRALESEGANVIVWDLNEDSLKDIEQDIIVSNGSLETMQVNALDYSEINKSVEQIKTNHSSVDIMVVCVGGGHDNYFVDTTEEFWRKELDYNLTTVFNCFHNVIQTMINQQNGRLLCFTSSLGGQPGMATYQVAKAGCKSLIETIAAEHGKDNITANAIMPGFVLTPYVQSSLDNEPGGKEKMEEFLQHFPLGPNTPENVARTALNILEDERLTGQVIPLR